MRGDRRSRAAAQVADAPNISLQRTRHAGQATGSSPKRWADRSVALSFRVDIYAATIPEFPFKPGVHVNYSQTVLRIRDGLPKLKDFPPELGGTGENPPE